LARRSPLNRKYLACLVRALNDAEPTVIALDIDLRSPIPQQGAEELPQYREETEDLLQAVKEVSQQRNVVLASTLSHHADGYSVSRNVFDGYDFGGGKVFHGYVTLPSDIRQIPLAVPVTNSAEKEESFASAIAKTRDKDVVAAAEQYQERGFPYGSFYGPGDFTKVSAGEVFQNGAKSLKEKIQGRVVIIGGGWHSGSYKGNDDITDDSVDLHFTPAKLIPGAYVHANYVEALVTGSVHPQLPEFVGTTIEVICSLVVAVVFALEGTFRQKFGRVIVLCIFLIIFTYVLWQNLGMFFDFFIPLLLLSVHAPIEQLRESRAELHSLRKRLHRLEHEPAPEGEEPDN